MDIKDTDINALRAQLRRGVKLALMPQVFNVLPSELRASGHRASGEGDRES